MNSVSIIVSAGGRPNHLRNTLRGWANIDYPDFDFTVVDNASKGADIEAVVKEVPSSFPITFHRENEWLNVNRIWNKYGQASRGEYVIFAMQDEIVSHGDVVQKMVEASECGCRASIFTYFMSQSETDFIATLPWQDDPTIIPLPFTDQTTAGLLSHIHGNYRKNWDWFGWFRDFQDGHLWLDQDVHLREFRLGKGAVTPKDVYCLHQYHPISPGAANFAKPGFTYANELQARLLEPAVRDEN